MKAGRNSRSQPPVGCRLTLLQSNRSAFRSLAPFRLPLLGHAPSRDPPYPFFALDVFSRDAPISRGFLCEKGEGIARKFAGRLDRGSNYVLTLSTRESSGITDRPSGDGLLFHFASLTGGGEGVVVRKERKKSITRFLKRRIPRVDFHSPRNSAGFRETRSRSSRGSGSRNRPRSIRPAACLHSRDPAAGTR